METQPGARTALVDPFGRELEEWLRDVPAFRTPYVSDLVVPPVTGPIRRPETPAESATDLVTDAVADGLVADAVADGLVADAVADGLVADETAADDLVAETPEPPGAPETRDASAASAASVASDASENTAPDAFRRERHGRRAAACAPSFPEPPERIALRIGDLAVLVSASSGTSTIERIELFELELEQRDEDLARLAAWESEVADNPDPEVAAARAFAHDVFADLLAEAAAETDRQERRAALEPVEHRDAAVAARPVSPLLASPVSASTRPTPLVQPATGPSAIQRQAFEEAIRAHSGQTAEVPTVLPEGIAPEPSTEAAAPVERPGWWARLVRSILGVFGRRAA
jgi:hypothetical protein